MKPIRQDAPPLSRDPLLVLSLLSGLLGFGLVVLSVMALRTVANLLA